MNNDPKPLAAPVSQHAGNMQHRGPWQCSYCPHTIAYDPDWSKMSEAIMTHFNEAQHVPVIVGAEVAAPLPEPQCKCGHEEHGIQSWTGDEYCKTPNCPCAGYVTGDAYENVREVHLPEPTISDRLESQLAARLEQMEEVSPLPEIVSEAPDVKGSAALLIAEKMWPSRTIQQKLAVDMWKDHDSSTFAGAAIEVIARLIELRGMDADAEVAAIRRAQIAEAKLPTPSAVPLGENCNCDCVHCNDGNHRICCRANQCNRNAALASKVVPVGEGDLQDDDFRPTKFHLSNGEVRATGILCGGAVANIARELLEIRAELARLRSQEGADDAWKRGFEAGITAADEEILDEPDIHGSEIVTAIRESICALHDAIPPYVAPGGEGTKG